MKNHLRVILIIGILGVLTISTMGNADHQTFLYQVQNNGADATAYLVDKATTYPLVMVGTHHRNAIIHDTIIDALPDLKRRTGLNTVFMEIPASEQETIDRFSLGLARVDEIHVWEILKSPSYNRILEKARDLELNIVAIDRPRGEKGSRDAWMSRQIYDHLKEHPGTRSVVIVGERHVLKNIQWKNFTEPSLADYLAPTRCCSIITWPEAIEEISPRAIDVDYWAFKGVRDSTLETMNIEDDVCIANTTDGIIFMPCSKNL